MGWAMFASQPEPRTRLEPAETTAQNSTVQVTPVEAVIGLLMAPDQAGQWYAPVLGKTRLIKEVFLVKMETEAGSVGALPFEFVAGKYGPWSSEVGDAIGFLDTNRYIDTTPERGSWGRSYHLTSEGRSLAIPLWKGRFTEVIRTAFHRVKSNYNDWSYNALMAYVYQAYPQYAANSLIKDEILGDDP